MKSIKFLYKGRNIQRIEVGIGDKYGIAMLAYFKNSMNGENVEKLELVDKKKVSLFYDKKMESYILQILDFNIANVEKHYLNFRKKYNVLIKDPICHFMKI